MGSIDKFTEYSKAPERNVVKTIGNKSLVNNNNESVSNDSDEEIPIPFPYAPRGKHKSQMAGDSTNSQTMRPAKQPKDEGKTADTRVPEADSVKAAKEKAQEKADKEKADKEKADKEKADKEKADKAKTDGKKEE